MLNDYLFVSVDDGMTLTWTDKVIRGKGQIGICLEAFEIEILKMIHVHKIVTASMATDMYMAYRPDSNRKSVSNRLAKLVKNKVLFRKKNANHFNGGQLSFFYSLGELGFTLMKKLNLEDYKIRQQVYEPSKIRIPNMHNFYASETIHRLYIENLQREEPYKLKILRGAASKLFKSESGYFKAVENQDESTIIPDYIISKDDIIICFESDMGTEKAKIIQKKEKMYCRIKETDAFRDKKVYVVYSVVEDRNGSDDNNLSKARRIHSLKSAHTPAIEWPEGLEFYVTSSNEVIELILRLLLESTYDISSEIKKLVLKNINSSIEEVYQSRNGWQSMEVNLEELLVDRRKIETLRFTTHSVKYFTRKGTVKTIVYMNGEFGSVRTYQLLQTLSSVLAVTNNTLFMQDYLPIEIVVCYLRSIDLTKEFFGFTPQLSIRLVNREDEQMRGLELVTAYKKEWKDW